MVTVLSMNPLPTHEQKLCALKKSLDTLYGTRATITTEVLARHAARKLNTSLTAMKKLIYELTPEERESIRMPPVPPGRVAFVWYREDGTPNRPL